MMGKNKNKHEKYKHHNSGEYVDGGGMVASPQSHHIAPVNMVASSPHLAAPGVMVANPHLVMVGSPNLSAPGVRVASPHQPAPGVPKLIVKFGADLTPERVDSPGEVLAYPLQSEQDQYQYHHRHKEKKKKKKKDKKKREDKERGVENREHRHHHKKKKKREYDSGESGGGTNSIGGGSTSSGHIPATTAVPQYYHNVQQQQPSSQQLPSLAVGSNLSSVPASASTSNNSSNLNRNSVILIDDAHQPPPSKMAKLESDSEGSIGGRGSVNGSVGVGGGMRSPKREVPVKSSASSLKQKSTKLTKVLEYLLVMLERKDMTNFFSQPVSDTFAPGYSQIIKEPMDFSTMNEKIEENKYESLNQFRRDFELICNNCMSYNTPETVYHKAAKRLLHAGRQILASGRLRTLAEHHMPMINELTPDLLGFDIKTELPAFIEAEDEKDILRVIAEIRGSIRLPQGRFAAIPDNLTAEEIASQTANAAKRAADRLSRRRPGSNMGYLRQKADGTTSLSIITPSSNSSVDANGEKTVTLGQLIGKVKNGASALQGFKEDRRNSVKAFNPIYYGAFSSYGPAYDSTFANLTKQETELVYNTYGDDVGVAYAESIKNFSKNCEYASFIVDNLLDILTGNEHKKTSKYIEEQKLLRSEESLVKSVFTSSDKTNNSNSNENNSSNSNEPVPVDFDSLRSLAKDGIDMSFLEGLQTQYTKLPTTRLDKNAVLLESLRDVQHQRLSGPPPQHLGQITGPSNEECLISERVQQNLVSLVGETRPTDVFIQGARS